jgi:hypothetical protein
MLNINSINDVVRVYFEPPRRQLWFRLVAAVVFVISVRFYYNAI